MDRTDRFGLQVSAALATIVVDLEVARALVPDLEHLPLPERRQLGRARSWRGTQRRAVLHYDRERRGEGEQHLRALRLRAHRDRRGPLGLPALQPPPALTQALAPPPRPPP